MADTEQYGRDIDQHGNQAFAAIAERAADRKIYGERSQQREYL
jgi:hypothetical protein